MPYPSVTVPLPGRESFSQTGPVAAQSQAAFLLLLGRRLRGDDEVLQARAIAAGGKARARVLGDSEDSDPDQWSFQVPNLKAMGGSQYLGHIDTDLQIRYQTQLLGRRASLGELLKEKGPELLGDLVKRLYKKPNAFTAAEILEACLHHPDELVRVAAASAYFDLRPEKEPARKILVDGVRSEENLVRDVARTSLSHVAPEHASLLSTVHKQGSAAAAGKLNTTLLIHGTFARRDGWWKPKGDFHDYILSSVKSDLYDNSDYFGWSGGYSDNARSEGARDLAAWIYQRSSADPPSLITHSHGGSVAILASESGLEIEELILLSCPVHIHKYFPNFSKVQRIVSIRVHMDLVILADRGGQRFKHSKIKEYVLPIWFDHTATHSPDVWKQYDVPSML